MFSNPYFYQFIQYLFSIPFVEQLFTVADGILRTAAVVKVGVEGVSVSLGPDKWAAKILCGTLAGCGGGLWVGKSLASWYQVGEWLIKVSPRCFSAYEPSMVVFYATPSPYCFYWYEGLIHDSLVLYGSNHSDSMWMGSTSAPQTRRSSSMECSGIEHWSRLSHFCVTSTETTRGNSDWRRKEGQMNDLIRL